MTILLVWVDFHVEKAGIHRAITSGLCRRVLAPDIFLAGTLAGHRHRPASAHIALGKPAPNFFES